MIAIIIAADDEYGIGKEGKIPWNFSEDLKQFKALTTENVIIMGRKTAESLPFPLPNRLNIVVSKNYERSGFSTFPTLNSAIEFGRNLVVKLPSSPGKLETEFPISQNNPKIFIIGGTQLIDEGINHPLCKEIYFTHVFGKFGCDVKLSKEFVKTFTQNFVLQKYYYEDDKFSIGYSTFQNVEEKSYLNITENILTNGIEKKTRNGPTRSLFGPELVMEVGNKVLALTSKQVFMKMVIEELLFFIRGSTNSKLLEAMGIKIWQGNTSRSFIDGVAAKLKEKKMDKVANVVKNYPEGDMGPMYGFQWRHFGAEYTNCNADYKGKGVDQFLNVIDTLKTDPDSRRILMTSYNPAQRDYGVLDPCHGIGIQFYVNGDYIDCKMEQRSADWMLGVPFNIASYSLLLHLVVAIVNADGRNYKCGRLIINFGDAHIYTAEEYGHVVGAKEQMKRELHKFPTLNLKKIITSIEDVEKMTFTDFEICNYICGKPIKMKMVA